MFLDWVPWGTSQPDRLNVFVPQNCLYWHPHFQWDVFRKRTLWGMNGTGVLIYKRDFRELSHPSAVWGHSKKTMTMNLEVGFHQTPNLTLDLPASRTVRNEMVPMGVIQPMVACYSSPGGLGQKLVLRRRCLFNKYLKMWNWLWNWVRVEDGWVWRDFLEKPKLL